MSSKSWTLLPAFGNIEDGIRSFFRLVFLNALPISVLLHPGNGMENSNFFFFFFPQKRSPRLAAHANTGKLSLEIEVHRDLCRLFYTFSPLTFLQRHEHIARGLRDGLTSPPLPALSYGLDFRETFFNQNTRSVATLA